MTEAVAHLVLLHTDLPSGLVSQLEVDVEYAPNKAHLRIVPAQPLGSDTPIPAALADHLRELGKALLHIADNPSAIYTHSVRRSSHGIP
jgi:hypothetical protein